jgi:hypothetical protein
MPVIATPCTSQKYGNMPAVANVCEYVKGDVCA